MDRDLVARELPPRPSRKPEGNQPHPASREETVSMKVLIAITASLSLFLTACGDKKEATPSGGGSSADKPAASSGGGAEVKLDPATAGTIKGIVKFGNAPDPMPKPIDMGDKT